MTVETGRDGNPKSGETVLGPSASRNNPSRDKGRSNICLRGILFMYNICFLVLGCAAVVWGVLSLVTESNAINIKGEFGLFLDANELDYQLHRVSTYLLVVVGVVVVPLAILGFYGSIRENKCVLTYYGSILILVLIILCVMAGFSFSFKTSLSDSHASRIKNVMRDSLSEFYGRDTRTKPENKLMTEAWDSMQRQVTRCRRSPTAAAVRGTRPSVPDKPTSPGHLTISIHTRKGLRRPTLTYTPMAVMTSLCRIR